MPPKQANPNQHSNQLDNQSSSEQSGTQSTSSPQQQNSQSSRFRGKKPAQQGPSPNSKPGPVPEVARIVESRQQAESSTQAQMQPSANTNENEGGARKKRRHRGGRNRRRNRRQSFAASSDQGDTAQPLVEATNLETLQEAEPTASMYRIDDRARRSEESLDSEVLLDHRTQAQTPRQRRPSILHAQSGKSSKLTPNYSQSKSTRKVDTRGTLNNSNTAMDSGSDEETTDRTPLISQSRRKSSFKNSSSYGGTRAMQSVGRFSSQRRATSQKSSASTPRPALSRALSSQSQNEDYDVNNPPSVPGSPRLLGQDSMGEGSFPDYNSPDRRRTQDTVITIDNDPARDDEEGDGLFAAPWRRGTGVTSVEDVCIPFEQMTDIAEEDYKEQHEEGRTERPRRRRKEWPDLSVLEEWSRDEKEARAMEGIKAMKVNEPVLVGGRLRPQKGAWRREDEEAPFRWTYFNEELDSSLRSHTLSGLQEIGHSFRQLFIPDPPEIDESSSEDEDEYGGSVMGSTVVAPDHSSTPVNGGGSRVQTRQSSLFDHRGFDLKPPHQQQQAHSSSGSQTPQKPQSVDIPPSSFSKPKRYGPRPVFWLDVLQPTWDEMRVLSRAFGIHKLTAEDIMEQEAREKVELFRNYYFVNYRTFEQDEKSSEYMDAVNMYFIVFKGGVISFHFNQMPHPPNVRRRIRQLAEHQYTDSDWIAYAIIDNITDAYAPLIEQIEAEVDEIDDEILRLHSRNRQSASSDSSMQKTTVNDAASTSSDHYNVSRQQQQQQQPQRRQRKKSLWPWNKTQLKESLYEKLPTQDTDENTLTNPPTDNGRDMLLRVGECRKRVMSLYRLLGNKADVIKGLAKRCTESPPPSLFPSDNKISPSAARSDVGLYLGDIQDHVVTMTGNLTHYENILSRAHSNYLAQINIGMNERAEQTADVLGKLTVLGTIVLPMNIVTGLWGMNCLVPGQVEDNPTLYWFFALTGFLLLFGLMSFFIAKKVYKIV